MAQLFRIQYQPEDSPVPVKVEDTNRQRVTAVARNLEAQGHKVRVETVWA